MEDQEKLMMKVAEELGLAAQHAIMQNWREAKTAAWRAGDAAAKLQERGGLDDAVYT